MCWVRRAALPVKLYEPWLGASRVIFAGSEISSSSVLGKTGTCNLNHLIFDGCGVAKELYYARSAGERLFMGNFGYCSHSHAGARRENENDGLEDVLSKLEMGSVAEIAEQQSAEVVGGEELLTELDFLDDDEKEASSEDSKIISKTVELVNSIAGAPNDGVFYVLNKWAEEGNKLGEKGMSLILDSLKRRRMHWRALQFSEWLETSKQVDINEQYYAMHIDCISYAQNLAKVESYFNKIPESFRGELPYRNLLKSCVRFLNVTKAEAVLKKMRELALPITADDFNQMIILYKRLGMKGISDILLTMQKQNVKPSNLTYRLLIDYKGHLNDITGMEHVVEDMKADGIEPDIYALAVMAQHYISRGFKHKAETVLKNIEEGKQQEKWRARRLLLLLYSSLGRDDKVGEIWRDCESEATIEESIAAIRAWGKFGKVEEAEAIFNMMDQKRRRIARVYSSLLNVYVDNKLLTKGKDLAKQMEEDGCGNVPVILDSLVRLYIEEGEVEKADYVLQKACHQKKMRPLFATHMAIMEQYAKRGDIHNTEKLFQRTKWSGYFGRLRPFEVLIQAYINAKTPAYALRERMKAQNVFPNRAFAKVLAQADPFRNSAVLDLLD